MILSLEITEKIMIKKLIAVDQISMQENFENS